MRPLVAVQIGFSVMVLFVAGLLLQSFDRLTHVDLGFAPEHVALVTVEARERLPPEVSRAAGRQLLDDVARLPGVQAASLSDWALFAGWSSGGHLQIPGRGMVQTRTLGVSAGFCRTMQIRMLDGREFEPRDASADDPTTVIVNETLARTYFPGESVVGRQLERTSRWGTTSLAIVGVATDVKNNSVRGTATPFVFCRRRGPGAPCRFARPWILERSPPVSGRCSRTCIRRSGSRMSCSNRRS